MDLIQAVILGVVEGITEFLPISSTGHLTIVEKMMGFPIDDPGVTAFTAIIQIGAVLATLVYFRKDIWDIANAWVRGLFSAKAREDQNYRFGWAVIVGTSGVPKDEAGLASGILNTSQQVGGAVGLAILTGIATSAGARYITNLNLHAAPTHDIVLAATVHGFQKGYLIASTFGIFASLIAIFMIKQAKGEKISVDPSAMAG